MCLHFISFLHTDMTQVVEILPRIRQEFTNSTESISWVLMFWRRRSQGIGIHDIDYIEPEEFGPHTIKVLINIVHASHLYVFPCLWYVLNDKMFDKDYVCMRFVSLFFFPHGYICFYLLYSPKGILNDVYVKISFIHITVSSLGNVMRYALLYNSDAWLRSKIFYVSLCQKWIYRE